MNTLQTFMAYLSDNKQAEAVLCISDNNDVKTVRQLQENVAAWIKTLSHIKDSKVALYHSDAFEFCSILIALWQLQKIAVIPASTSPEFTQPLAAITDVFVGEFTAPDTIKQSCSNQGTGENSVLDKNTGNNSEALIIFTSGSSGEASPISKTFAQLNAELATLENQWGDKLNDTTIVGTVSHHHIYGLLFRLLWPLVTQRVFVSKIREYWEDVLLDSEKLGQISLIASPAHLERIPPENTQAEQWKALKNNCQIIFSSGAPLALKHAEEASSRFEQSIYEVYGSSETGGVAWRIQKNNPYWTPFSGISVQQENGLLYIQSPHIAPENLTSGGCNIEQWFATSDKCEIHENQQFELQGRADRIVKVGGKRISLTRIEEKLLVHPWVEECRTLSLEQHNHRIGAVVALTQEGREALIDKGKKSINDILHQHLRNDIEAIAIPRYWRYMKELPRNSQGKILHSQLEAQFDKNLPKLPLVVNTEHENTEATLFLELPYNLYYFDGHFPGNPVLPGVVQTHWAIHYGKELFNIQGEFSHLEAIKFQHIITPENTLTLKIKYNEDKNKLTFSYSATNIKYSSGRVAFKDSQPEHMGNIEEATHV